MPAKKTSRCWPGYEPVPGKAEHEQGSCRPKAKSKATPSEKKAQAARKREVDKFQKAHPGSPRSAAQGHSATAKKKAAPKKAAAKKSTAKRAARS